MGHVRNLFLTVLNPGRSKVQGISISNTPWGFSLSVGCLLWPSDLSTHTSGVSFLLLRARLIVDQNLTNGISFQLNCLYFSLLLPFFKTRSHYVALRSPQNSQFSCLHFPNSWNYRYVPPCQPSLPLQRLCLQVQSHWVGLGFNLRILGRHIHLDTPQHEIIC